MYKNNISILYYQKPNVYNNLQNILILLEQNKKNNNIIRPQKHAYRKLQ